MWIKETSSIAPSPIPSPKSINLQQLRCSSEVSSYRKSTGLVEREFFKLVVLSMILNLQPFVINFAFEQNDANEMYKRAQKDGVKFNDFIEWIQHDLNK